MPEISRRSLSSYHTVSSSEPSAIFDGEHHKLPHKNDRSPGHDDQGPAGHRASHLIPRKPIPHHDTERNPEGAEIATIAQEPDAASPPSRKSSKHGRFEVFSIWWLEIVCCAIFTGSFLAIFATLYSSEGRPLPEWPYHLTINTLIAIYVVILKAALLFVTAQGLGQLKWQWFERERPLNHFANFDSASRGAWGSLSLLWMLKGRHIIASCGAFITVAALLTDPFAQQVISTYQCMLNVQSSQATIPRTNFFDEYFSHVEDLPLDLSESVIAGIFNPGTQVAFGCPSGNCTFPNVYHSVGYCSSCNDTTGHLLITNEVTPGGLNYTNVSLPGYFQGDGWWQAPVAAILSGTNSDGEMLYDPITAYFVMDYDAGAVVAAQVNNTLGSSCSKSSEKRWGCAAGATSGVGAARCTIVPCVRSYSASIAAGRLSEDVVSASNLWVWDTLNLEGDNQVLQGTINLACLPPGTRARLSELDFKHEENGWLSTPNLTSAYGGSGFPIGDYWIPTRNKASLNVSIPAECVYLWSNPNDAIQSYLSSYLNGTVGVIPEDPYSYAYRGADQLLAIYNDSNLSFEDLNSTFANVSDSLTTHIRQNGVQNFSSPAHGTILHEQTCVRVRWAWLAYLAILVGLTLIFLTGMIVETRAGERESHDWKSEPVALMFHRLDDEMIRATGAGMLVKTRDMQDVAKRVRVRLGRNEDGWGFVGGEQRDEVSEVLQCADGWRKLGQKKYP